MRFEIIREGRIALAMVRPDRGTLTQGLRKAKMAHGQSASEDAQSAIAALLDRDRDGATATATATAQSNGAGRRSA